MSEVPGRACPKCARPAATTGPRCLYCGAPLPEAAPARETGEPAVADTGEGRLLLVVEVGGQDPARIGAGLMMQGFEAAQLVRRGGFHLHRAADPAAVRAEEARLRAAGLVVWVVPEPEARVRPIVALRGRLTGGALSVRHAAGELGVSTGDVLMLVQGPIAREYQSQQSKRPRTATLEAGYRFHVHRRADPRPLELDPGAFEFGPGAGEGSSLLRLSAWVRELCAGAPTDDGFRRLPPALGAASGETEGAVSVTGSLAPARRDKDAPIALDNLAQFRFYSGWRAAVERRRAG